MISADRFKWDKGFGRANASDLGFEKCFCPDHIQVKSPLTGKVIDFKLDEQEAIDAESWDGEFRILRSEDKKFAVKVWNY
jgi:hypothetical protein